MLHIVSGIMKRKVFLLAILISTLAVDVAITESCGDSRRLESTCGGYCFKIVKVLLDHTKSLHKQVDTNESNQKSETLNKLERVESLLNEKFSMLENVVNKLESKARVRITDENNMEPFQKIGLKYYYIENNKTANWFKAAQECKKLGGHLGNIQSMLELEELSRHITNEYYWIDINDLVDEGAYISLATGNPATFLNWHAGEPTNSGDGENCVQFRNVNSVYKMNDNNCRRGYNYICEI